MDDIREADFILDWYAQRNVTINKIIDGEYTPEDYKNPENRDIYTAGMYWYPYVINKASFEALNINKDKIPPGYQPVIKSLNSLYLQTNALLETAQKYMDDHLNQYRNYLVNEEAWFIDYSQNQFTNPVADYFGNSALHKRKLLRYQDLSGSITNTLTQIRSQAVFNYLLIHEMLMSGEPYPAYFQGLPLQIPEEKLKGINGSYSNADIGISIAVEHINTLTIFNIDSKEFINSQPFLLADLPGDTLGNIRNGIRAVFLRDQTDKVLAIKIIEPNGLTYTLAKEEGN